ncbi:hypothetical protein GEMRC1_011442 [Eukaryota sp. GEM-RC1]
MHSIELFHSRIESDDFSFLDDIYHSTSSLIKELSELNPVEPTSDLSDELTKLIKLKHQLASQSAPQKKTVTRSTATSPPPEDILPIPSPQPSPLPVVPTLTPPTSPRNPPPRQPSPVSLSIQVTPQKPTVQDSMTSPLLPPKEALRSPPPEIKPRLIPVKTALNVNLSTLSGLSYLVAGYPELMSAPINTIVGAKVFFPQSDELSQSLKNQRLSKMIDKLTSPIVSSVLYGLNPHVVLSAVTPILMSPLLSTLLKSAYLSVAVSITSSGKYVCNLNGKVTLENVFNPGGIALNLALARGAPMNIVNALEKPIKFDTCCVDDSEYCSILVDIYFKGNRSSAFRSVIPAPIRPPPPPVIPVLKSRDHLGKEEVGEKEVDDELVVEEESDHEEKVASRHQDSGHDFLSRYGDLDPLLLDSSQVDQDSDQDSVVQLPVEDPSEVQEDEESRDEEEESEEENQEQSEEEGELSEEEQEVVEEVELSSDDEINHDDLDSYSVFEVDDLPLSLLGSDDALSTSSSFDFTRNPAPLPPKPPSRGRPNIPNFSNSSSSVSIDDPELAHLCQQVDKFGDLDLLSRAGIDMDDFFR